MTLKQNHIKALDKFLAAMKWGHNRVVLLQLAASFCDGTSLAINSFEPVSARF